MSDLSHIKNYILHLREREGLAITVHPLTRHCASALSPLLIFNIHDNSYCVYLKTCLTLQAHCIERQHRITDKCKARGIFDGVCFAGVRERIYPIYGHGEVQGFISVSGYRIKDASSYIRRVSREFNLPEDEMRSLYSTLKEDMPSSEELDVFLRPLCDMLELALTKVGDDSETLSFGEEVLRYVRQYHAAPITSEDICRHFSCSRTKVSTEFNRHTGMSLREYITFLRIEDAKALLLGSGLNVTEIAYSVGFTDSNYFSAVFKRSTSLSPMAYRKKYASSKKS